MQVEIWSDVVCPFCYIGKRGFEEALERFEHRDEVSVQWRSFQLDPSMPAAVEGGLELLLARKYGRSPDEARGMNERVTGMAAEAGLAFRLDRARPGNTLDAHRALHLARARGLEEPLLERLLQAYFVEGALLSDHPTLVRLAVEVGLDGDELERALAGDAFEDAVRAEGDEAHDLGLGGVPAFVLDRRMLVTGAQPADALLQALRRAWEAGQPISGGASR